VNESPAGICELLSRTVSLRSQHLFADVLIVVIRPASSMEITPAATLFSTISSTFCAAPTPFGSPAGPGHLIEGLDQHADFVGGLQSEFENEIPEAIR